MIGIGPAVIKRIGIDDLPPADMCRPRLPRPDRFRRPPHEPLIWPVHGVADHQDGIGLGGSPSVADRWGVQAAHTRSIDKRQLAPAAAGWAR